LRRPLGEPPSHGGKRDAVWGDRFPAGVTGGDGGEAAVTGDHGKVTAEFEPVAVASRGPSAGVGGPPPAARWHFLAARSSLVLS
jgi:hypothetical protein